MNPSSNQSPAENAPPPDAPVPAQEAPTVSELPAARAAARARGCLHTQVAIAEAGLNGFAQEEGAPVEQVRLLLKLTCTLCGASPTFSGVALAGEHTAVMFDLPKGEAVCRIERLVLPADEMPKLQRGLRDLQKRYGGRGR